MSARRKWGHRARGHWGILLSDELDIDTQLDEVRVELAERPPSTVEEDWRARFTESC